MMRSLPLLLLSLAPIGVLSQRVTRDATCGGSKGYTCLGSSFGNCCSQYGWCGSTEDYCGKGCNSNFGRCNTIARSSSSTMKPSSSTRASSVAPSTPSSQPVSTNARCGPSFGGRTCLGSKWGDCCSQYGYCGSTKDYCSATSCQKGYGKCNTVSSSSIKPSASSKASSASFSQANSAASSQANPAPSSPVVSSSSSRISSAASAPASSVSSVSIFPSVLTASPSAAPSASVAQSVSSAASVGQSSSPAEIISLLSSSTAVPSSSSSSSNAASQQSNSAAPISSTVPSMGSSSSQFPSEGVALQSSSVVPSVPQPSVPSASTDLPPNSVPSQASSIMSSSSVNNDSPPFTPTASVVLPSDPEQFLATYTFQDDPLPTPIAMGTPPIEGGASGAELSIPQKCMIVPGQSDATFQLLEPKDRVPLTKRNDGTLGPIPAPKSEAEFLAMPPIDDLKITSFALVSSSNGLFDLVSMDSPRKYVAKKADGSVILIDQSTNDAQTTTSIFDVTCEGRITIRIDTQYYSWALNGEATAMEKILDKTETMYTLPDNPSAVTRRRRSKSQEGIAPRCNAYPRDLEARVFPGARGNNPNKCGSSSFKVPDLSFGHCCDQHDNDFDNCGMTFEEGNNAFRNCMRGSGCEQFNKWYLYPALVGCRKTADFYYSVVSGYFGMKAFYQANSDRCKCYCPSSSPHGCMVNGQFQCLNVLSTDTNNCGACGRVCPQGSRCENGQCKCPAEQCGDRCVSLSSHPRNCGQCGRVSPSGYCVQGQFYSPPAFCSRGNGFRNGNFANGANYWSAQIVSGGGNSRFDVGGDGGAEDSDRMVGIFSLYAPNGGANLKTSVKMCPGTAYNLQFQIRRPYGTDSCNYYVYLAGELKRTGPVPQPTNIGTGWVWVNGMRAGPFFGERQGVSAAGPELWADFQLDIRCSGGTLYNFIRVDQFSINPA